MNLSDVYAGIRVCDLSQGIAGPHATMLLAQYGAEVIKVEPEGGDWGRGLGPLSADHSPLSLVFNAGKRGLALDLKSEEGRGVLRALIAACPVFVESFRPGVAAKLGISYDDVRRIRPDVIYASMSGYGQRGPNSTHATTDTLIQGFSGMMVMNQTPQGDPHRQNMPAVDVLSGLYLHAALAAAISRQRSTGEGCYLDVSLMQSAAAFQSGKIMEFYGTQGAPLPMYAPTGYLKTSDGGISMATMRKEQYEALCKTLQREDLITHEDYAEVDTRIGNARKLMAELDKESRRFSTKELVRLLNEVDVMAAPVQSFGDWLEDEHVKEVTAYSWVDTDAGRMPMATIPGLPPAESAPARAHSPRIGEHSAQILAELGYGAEQATEMLGRAVFEVGKMQRT